MSLQTYFGPCRGLSVVEAKVKFGYFIGGDHLAFLLADRCIKLFHSVFPDSAIAKEFKCGCTKATAVLKVIAHMMCCCRLRKPYVILSSSVFKLIFQLHSKWQSCYAFFDNKLGRGQCVFFALESVKGATADLLFQAIDGSLTLCYSDLVGFGSDDANVMLGQRNSVLSSKTTCCDSPTLHIATLVANAAYKGIPDDVEELTKGVFYFQKRPKRIGFC